MIKSKGRRITWFVLTLILAMGMIGSSVFAAVPQETPGDGDGTTQLRMARSTHVGYLTLDKVFERYGTQWPANQNSFKYEIEKVRFWDNSNVDTLENGTSIVAEGAANREAMPNPTAGDAPNAATSIVQKTTGNNNIWVVDVPVSLASSNQTDAPTGVVATKTGEKQVTFDFQRPGYYVYKVTEQDDKVAGVTYDNHTYFICFYVANKTKDGKATGETSGGKYGKTNGNTDTSISEDADKLYVHTITAWRQEALTGTNKQIFESIVIPQAVDPSYKTNNTYFMKIKYDEQFLSDEQKASEKVYYADPLVKDGEGKVTNTPIDVKDLVKGGTYWIEVTQEEVDAVVERGEVGKVDRSQEVEVTHDKKVGPNCLEINFWNETDSKDVELKKIVTGTLGDLNKEFEFTVSLTGLQKNASYKIVPDGANLDSSKVQGLAKDEGTGEFFVRPGDKTTAEFKVVLKGGESIKIEGLPTGATYTTSEEKSDHVASYKVESAGFEYTLQKNDTAASLNADGYRLVVRDDKNNITDIRALKDEDLEGKTKIQIVKLANYKKGNEQSGTALALANTETVDPGDGQVTITYTNHRDIETETGIPGYVFPIVLAAMIALIGLAAVRRRKDVASVNDFEF